MAGHKAISRVHFTICMCPNQRVSFRPVSLENELAVRANKMKQYLGNQKEQTFIMGKVIFMLLFCFLNLFGCARSYLWPGMEPRPAALGAWSLNQWTTREVLGKLSFDT